MPARPEKVSAQAPCKARADTDISEPFLMSTCWTLKLRPSPSTLDEHVLRVLDRAGPPS